MLNKAAEGLNIAYQAAAWAAQNNVLLPEVIPDKDEIDSVGDAEKEGRQAIKLNGAQIKTIPV